MKFSNPLRSLLELSPFAFDRFAMLFVLAGIVVLDVVVPSNATGSNVELAKAGDVSESIPCTKSIASTGEDRLWVVNSRMLTSQVGCADLESPGLTFSRVSSCGQSSKSSLPEYIDMLATSPHVVVYVHGNLLSAPEAIERSAKIRSKINRYRRSLGVDWVIWSWPASKTGLITSDMRRKDKRCDAQGLYLAWLLRHHAEHQSPTSLIGYSFGARILTGALHAAAGGQLGGRRLPGDPVIGMQTRVGLVAPALESRWLSSCGYHKLATQNIKELSLLYNRRDAILKRYWLLRKVRGESALGYTGPTSFARRVDGTRLPVHARDCAAVIGLHHVELDYYKVPCHAGRVMANLLHDVTRSP